MGFAASVLWVSVRQVRPSPAHGYGWLVFRHMMALKSRARMGPQAQARRQFRSWLAETLNTVRFPARFRGDVRFVVCECCPPSAAVCGSYWPCARQIWLRADAMPDARVLVHECAHHFWEHHVSPAEIEAFDRVVRGTYLPLVASLQPSPGTKPDDHPGLFLSGLCVYGTAREVQRADPDELYADILTYYLLPPPALHEARTDSLSVGYFTFRRIFGSVIEGMVAEAQPIRPEDLRIVYAEGWHALPEVLAANAVRMPTGVFLHLQRSDIARRHDGPALPTHPLAHLPIPSDTALTVAAGR
ncbi:MAG: hypothetical protein JXR77_14635 [Lentisphaeria bacterium]|nr:hypothetical protein [Lentisphaeria bacterium]